MVELMKTPTGIAGAEDYVPASTGSDTWTCATCGKEIDKEIPSVRAWADKGLKQECKECYNITK